MEEVDSAEKEASEVLHSLLSVERLEKSSIQTHGSTQSTTDHSDIGNQIQWHNALGQTIFTTTNDQFQQGINEHEVIWEDDQVHIQSEIKVPIEKAVNYLQNETADEDICDDEDEELDITEEVKPRPKPFAKKLKTKKPLKKNKKLKTSDEDRVCERNEPTKLETNVSQVRERFKRGCECQDESCFRGLNPENVYKHRLNIAELTKAEHDMYLMGVTMACLANPDTTVKQKERRRLRAQYVYQGRRVCLDAFLYLENCTHYQIKRIRKHVMTHGVAPRVHGNHGKKPHNTFPLDIYRHATEFLKQYVQQHTGDSGLTNPKQIIQLPCDTTRKNLHDAYKEYGQILEPGIKLMGYSTFRHFMKVQFPQVKFSKMEAKPTVSQVQHIIQQQQQPVQVQQQSQQQPPPPQKAQAVPANGVQVQPTIKQTIQPVKVENHQQNIQIQKCVISNEAVQQVIPLVMAHNDGAQHPQAYIVTPVPVPQLISNGSIAQTNASAANSFSYQLTNGYVINDQGNIVVNGAMTNAQTPQFTFNRI